MARKKVMPVKLKLAFDARMLGHSGIGTQVENVLKILIQDSSVELRLYGTEDAIANHLPEFNGRIIHCDADIYSLKEQFEIPAQDGFLHYFPHYNAPVKLLSKSCVMVHDLIHLDSEEFASPVYRLYAKFMLSRIARSALKIFTVSNYSKSRYRHYFPKVKNKITVIANGLDHKLFKPATKKKIEELSQQFNLPKKFFLCVGIGKKHKNLDLVVKALSPLWHEDLSYPLVIAGAGGDIPGYVNQIVAGEKVRPNIISVPFLDASQLVTLYSAATWLLMPSKLEGFGFPVIESMACGTPVACATSASLPEIGQDAVLYFDPKVPEDLRKLTDRLHQSQIRTSFKRKGLKHAAGFSWEQHVDTLIAEMLKTKS